MIHRTLVLSSIERYTTAYEGYPQEIALQNAERDERLQIFPYSLMLELAFPELDFAVRWCWQHFGPMEGECTQRYSEYRTCFDDFPHGHSGRWITHWFAKSDYDYGFNEWYFCDKSDRDYFLANLDEINWGEKYPK